MSWTTRWKLIQILVEGLSAPTDVLDEQLTMMRKEVDTIDEDMISQWIDELVSEFPELLPSLVHERDMYLAWSLKRSKAVNGTERVVGVVGRGHMRGIMHALKHDPGNLRFSDLVGGKNRKPKVSKEEGIARIAGRLALEIASGYACYVAWTHFTQ